MNPDGTADSASEPNLEAALALASATGSLETAMAPHSRVWDSASQTSAVFASSEHSRRG